MSPAGDSRGYESKKSSMASVQVSGTDKARDLKFLKKLEKYRTRSRGSSRANAGFGSAKKLRGAAKGVHVELLRLNPSGKQLCSDNLIEKAKAQGLRFEHLGVTIGTVIHNVDLRKKLSPTLVQTIKQTLNERKVIFFRNQDLTREEHLEFGRNFGELEIHPFGKSVDGYPEILPIYNDARFPGAINNWHSDVTWRTEPSLGSILYMRECPDFGGDTLFSDSHAAFEGLPDHVKKMSMGKSAIHDFENFRRSQLAQGVPKKVVDEMKEHFPLASHPVIRTHPETGKNGIYINIAFTKYIEGLPIQASQNLFRTLIEAHKSPEYQCRFIWEKGSIAFWDNRAVQHYASSDYFPSTRSLDRVTICGDRPFFIANHGKL